MKGEPLVSTVASMRERLRVAADEALAAAVEAQRRCDEEGTGAPWKTARQAIEDVQGITMLVKSRLRDKANAVAVRQLLVEGSAVLLRLVADLDLFIEEHRGDHED